MHRPVSYTHLTLPLLYQVIGPVREEAIRLVAQDVKPVFDAA